MSHTHLNYLKCCQILALWKAGFNQNQIAKEVVDETYIKVKGEWKYLYCALLTRMEIPLIFIFQNVGTQKLLNFF